MHSVDNQNFETEQTSDREPKKDRPWAIFFIFLRLGLTSFGGPVAHLAFFREAFVANRSWLSEQSYADLVALCQFLPGPASSQVGLGLGYERAGVRGALAAWAGFTLPSAFILIAFALGMSFLQGAWVDGAISGLKLVALAVVAHALWGMAKSLCPDSARISLMLLCASILLVWPSLIMQVGVILLGAFVGLFVLPIYVNANLQQTPPVARNSASKGVRFRALFALVSFGGLLVGLPLLSATLSIEALTLFDSFYRSGALVFGGGHVVLPLLQAETVAAGMISDSLFLAGYGVTQAVPGPIFTFAAYLGAASSIGPGGVWGGLLCLVAIFLPSLLLLLAALPFWNQLRAHARVRDALSGINAAVVGLLLATLYQPVWLSSVFSAQHFAFALLAFAAMFYWRLPVWAAVIVGGLLGAAIF